MKFCDFKYNIGDMLKLDILGKVERCSIQMLVHTGDDITSVVVKSLRGEITYLSAKRFKEAVRISEELASRKRTNISGSIA
ncbi:hypothetical protein ACEV6Q_04080 [Enterobacter ludwigii]|uniref:hypothetical protein n=1 Tax=Enterobacter ludwigii TaxID=299767 RepID=UPI003BEF12A3